jgi:hypothetical protein
MTSNNTNTEIRDLFEKMKTAREFEMPDVAEDYQKQIDDLLDLARSTAVNNEPTTSASSSSSSSSSSVTADLKKRSINNDQTDQTVNHTPIPASSAASSASASFASASSTSSASSASSSVSITSKKRSNDQTIKLNHSPIQASTYPSSVLHLQKKPRTEDLNNASLLLYQRNEIEPIIQKRNDNNNKSSFHDASHASLGVSDPKSTFSKGAKFFDDSSKYIL